MQINEHIEQKFRHLVSSKNNQAKQYFSNAKSDAIYCFDKIKKYISKDIQILEVGGGIHLLTDYLNENKYYITSIEPGNFAEYIDDLRNDILKISKLQIINDKIENIKDDLKFDFIFSQNVLEHTQDPKKHLLKCISHLKDEKSILLIRSPNYSFPFEPHFYKFFLPFFPNFTFNKLLKKKLIRELGEKQYYNIIRNLNFNCKFNLIKKLNLNVLFIHPLSEIFERIENDTVFRDRLFKNKIIKFFINFIKFAGLKKILVKIVPISLSPYLIMVIKKPKV